MKSVTLILLALFFLMSFETYGEMQEIDRTRRFAETEERWFAGVAATSSIDIKAIKDIKDYSGISYTVAEFGRLGYTLKKLPKLTIGTTGFKYLFANKWGGSQVYAEKSLAIYSILPMRVDWKLWKTNLLWGDTGLDLSCESSLWATAKEAKWYGEKSSGASPYIDAYLSFTFNPLRVLPLNVIRIGYRWIGIPYIYVPHGPYPPGSIHAAYLATSMGLGYHYYNSSKKAFKFPNGVYISLLDFTDTNGDKMLGPGEEGKIIIEIGNGSDKPVKPELSVSIEATDESSEAITKGIQIQNTQKLRSMLKGGKQKVEVAVKAAEDFDFVGLAALNVKVKDNLGKEDIQRVAVQLGESIAPTTESQRQPQIASIKPQEIDRPEQIQSVSETASQRWAVVVGVSNYKDSRIPSLRYAAKDAQTFYDWLISPQGGRYAPDHVKLLIDENATLRSIREALFTWLKQAIEEDVVIIYFSGHGSPESPDAPENLFLLPCDTDYDAIRVTGFPMWDIETALKRDIRARKVVVMADACHAGGVGAEFVDARKGFIQKPLINNGLQSLVNVGDGVAVLTASDDKQFSQESQKWGDGHGAFTWFLLQGLRGEADYNGDGRTTLGELIPYLSEKVRRETKNAQSPTVAGKFDPALTIGK